MVISIVIDSDRGHCYGHFKKKNQMAMKIEPVTCICVCNEFWAARNGKKVKFVIFQAQPASVIGFFHPYFVCKSSFRVISMIKMVIVDQSKPISLYLKIKSKIQKSEICKLYVYYS